MSFRYSGVEADLLENTARMPSDHERSDLLDVVVRVTVGRSGDLRHRSPGGTRTEVVDGFRQGLREHGYIEGQNLLIEWRFGEGRHHRLPGFAADLVRLRVEVIVTFAPEAALAAKNATATIPMFSPKWPIAFGIVSSLARPGGNLSGFSILAIDLTGKRLELFKNAVPS